MTQKVLITGGNGQLATCFRDLKNDDVELLFANSNELDITNQQQVKTFFNTHKVNWCVNCAAYTAVDLAESNYEKAYAVNTIGVKNIAEACEKNNVKLIHISTDFVFDGKKSKPYIEDERTNPINVYGKTKLKGETEIINILSEYFIIRTSWLYSEYGHNFVKTMLRLSEDKEQISVVGDQVGTPTYAKDLANAILHIIANNHTEYGLYHYSNQGVASWYDFAKAIFDIKNINITLNNIKTEDFKTQAKRPNFSVLDKTKIQKKLNLKIPYWRDSLKQVLKKLNDE